MRGCSWRDGWCGADSSEHLILQGRRAKFPWIKTRKGNLRSWSRSEWEMRQHLRAQRAENTRKNPVHVQTMIPQTPWKQVGPLEKLLPMTSSPRRLAIGFGGTGLSPIFPGSTSFPPKPHRLPVMLGELIPPLRRFPRHLLPSQASFQKKKQQKPTTQP